MATADEKVDLTDLKNKVEAFNGKLEDGVTATSALQARFDDFVTAHEKQLKELEARLNSKFGIVNQRLDSQAHIKGGGKSVAIGDSLPGHNGEVVAVGTDGSVVIRGKD